MSLGWCLLPEGGAGTWQGRAGPRLFLRKEPGAGSGAVSHPRLEPFQRSAWLPAHLWAAWEPLQSPGEMVSPWEELVLLCGVWALPGLTRDEFQQYSEIRGLSWGS